MSDARLEAAMHSLRDAEQAIRSYIDSPPSLTYSGAAAALEAFKFARYAQVQVDMLRMATPPR